MEISRQQIEAFKAAHPHICGAYPRRFPVIFVEETIHYQDFPKERTLYVLVDTNTGNTVGTADTLATALYLTSLANLS